MRFGSHVLRTPVSVGAPMPTCYIRTTTVSDGQRYSVLYRMGGRYTGIKSAGTFRTQRDAIKRKTIVASWLAEGKNPAVELTHVVAETLTVRQACDTYLAARRGLAENTRDNYAVTCLRICGEIGTVKVGDLTVQQVSDMVGKLTASYKPSTVAQTVTLLAAVLDAMDVTPNPARSKLVQAPRVGSVTMVPPTASEVERMLGSVKRDYLPLLVLLERTGVRVSEGLGIRARDVDRAGGRVLVRAEVAKGGRARWVPLPEWLEPRAFGTANGVYRAMMRACQKAKVRGFSPHELRHRRASLWHLGGVPVVQAAAWLGHSPMVHLRTYAHVMPLDEVTDDRMVSFLNAS